MKLRDLNIPFHITEVSDDHELLISLVEGTGFKVSAVRHTVGTVLARMGLWRLVNNGLRLGELGKFESLELISVGIQGKRLLWRTFGELQESYPAWEATNFHDLELEAMKQRDGVEKFRLREAKLVFGAFGDE